MTFLQATEYLHQLEKQKGICPGLERMHRLLEQLHCPQKKLRVIHIAGTNGKGSTARMIQAMLTAGGYRTGLFTSPAVTGICDTVTIDGTAIRKQRWARYIEKIYQVQKQTEEPATSFEVQTAAALLYFADCDTDVCVIECGMGGEKDATNVFDSVLCAVLTPISLEHTAFLGETVAQIAKEKAGIFKSSCPAVTSVRQNPEALSEIYRIAAQKGITVYMPGSVSLTSNSFMYAESEYRLSLYGHHQIDNACTALQVMEVLQHCGFATDISTRQKALQQIAMPCRQEVLRSQPLLLLDGAHNPDNMLALAETLHRLGGKYVFLLGMLADKDTVQCCRLLAPYMQAAVCCTPSNARALPASILAQQLRQVGVACVTSIADPTRAYRYTVKTFAQQPIIVAGSLYLCADLRPKLMALVQDKKKGQ